MSTLISFKSHFQMTSVKRNVWSLRLGIITLCILGGVARHMTQQPIVSSPSTNQLGGVWGRLQEKIPNHDMLIRQNMYMSFPASMYSTTTAATFTIHPSLFDEKRSSGDNLLSGNVSLTSKRRQSLSNSGAHDLSLGIDASIAGIIDEKTEVAVDIEGNIEAIHTNSKRYVHLSDLVIDQQGKQIELLMLRKLLLTRFENTWIQLEPEHADMLGLFSPQISNYYIENNTKKVRLIPTADGAGHLFTLSGESLILTGSWTSPINHDLHVDLPLQDISASILSSTDPSVDQINITQLNDYGGSFVGTIQHTHAKKEITKTTIGELLFPGGVRADIRLITKLEKLSEYSPPTLPKQYMKRKKLLEAFASTKKQDLSLD